MRATVGDDIGCVGDKESLVGFWYFKVNFAVRAKLDFELYAFMGAVLNAWVLNNQDRRRNKSDRLEISLNQRVAVL